MENQALGWTGVSLAGNGFLTWQLSLTYFRALLLSCVVVLCHRCPAGKQIWLDIQPIAHLPSYAHGLLLPRRTASNPCKEAAQLTGPEELALPVCPDCLTPGSKEAKCAVCGTSLSSELLLGCSGRPGEGSPLLPCPPAPAFLLSCPSWAWTLADTGWRLLEGKAGEGVPRSRWRSARESPVRTPSLAVWGSPLVSMTVGISGGQKGARWGGKIRSNQGRRGEGSPLLAQAHAHLTHPWTWALQVPLSTGVHPGSSSWEHLARSTPLGSGRAKLWTWVSLSPLHHPCL